MEMGVSAKTIFIYMPTPPMGPIISWLWFYNIICKISPPLVFDDGSVEFMGSKSLGPI